MLRLTKKADYGLIAVKHLAEHASARAQSAKDIAEAYRIPVPLLAKILQQLTRAGILVSHSGINGGYSLARGADATTAFEVIRAIEGPLFITSCMTTHGACDLTDLCTVRDCKQGPSGASRKSCGKCKRNFSHVDFREVTDLLCRRKNLGGNWNYRKVWSERKWRNGRCLQSRVRSPRNKVSLKM